MRSSKTLSRLVVPALLVLANVVADIASAEMKLPSVLTSNMVLQRDKPVAIWGWADPGEKVTVTFSGQTKTATASEKGTWRVTLDPLAAEPEQTGQKLVVEGAANTHTLENVLVGEVWLCSGQSNMEWTVGQSANAAAEISAAAYPQIRHIKIAHTPAAEPLDNARTDGWRVCSPQSAGGFTGVGYYFARKLHKELKVPVGLIGSNWGGTRIEPWIPPDGFHAVEALKDIADNLDQFPKGSGNRVQHQSALALYNGMIHPLVPFAIRGALWYQGESNMGEGMLYHEKMKALISGWRKVWGQDGKEDSFPFYFVQLAPFRGYGGGALPALWEAQTATLAIPNTGMSVITDITGNVGDIHPRNKQDVGLRLALWALARTYHRPGIVYSGPLYQSMKIEGNKVRLYFAHTGSGLKSRDGRPLTEFMIAGQSGEYVPATATIDGRTVVIHAADVASPTRVRFGWQKTTNPNLSNNEGLPAGPFQTENWRGATGGPSGPTIAYAGRPLVIDGIRLNLRDPAAEWSAQLFYRNAAEGEFRSVTASETDEGRLTATVPGEATGGALEYYFQINEKGRPPANVPPEGAEAPLKVLPDLEPPTAVSDLATVEVKDYRVRLNWKASKDDHEVVGYRVYRGDRDGFTTDDASAQSDRPETSLNFVDHNPPTDQAVYYAVRAVDIVGRQGEPGYLKVDVPANRPPKNDFKLDAVAAAKKVFLRWSGTPEPDVVAIEILRGDGQAGELKLLETVKKLTGTYYADETVEADKDYRYALRLRDRGELVSNGTDPRQVRTGLYLKRINCGGDTHIGADGIPWEKDLARSAGTGRFNTRTNVAGVPDDLQAIYQTERWSYRTIRYSFDLKPARYQVVLHFAETNRAYSAPGMRTFDVLLAGEKRHEGVDVCAEAGAATGWQLATEVDVTKSPLVIELQKARAGPSLKGIEVREVAKPNR